MWLMVIGQVCCGSDSKEMRIRVRSYYRKRVTEKYDDKMSQVLNQDDKLPKVMQELEIYVFGVAEGSICHVMVPEGGDEAETDEENLMGIFFSLLTY